MALYSCLTIELGHLILSFPALRRGFTPSPALVHGPLAGLKERTNQQFPHLPLKSEHPLTTKGRQWCSKTHERPKNLIISVLTCVISEQDVIRRKVSLSGNPGDFGIDGGGRKRAMISPQIEGISAFKIKYQRPGSLQPAGGHLSS